MASARITSGCLGVIVQEILPISVRATGSTASSPYISR